MRYFFKTVKSRVIIMMILFALFVTIIVLLVSFYLMSVFQRQMTIRSTEFNLQLVAGMLNQDLTNLTAFGKWCGSSEYISDYLLSVVNVKAHSLRAFNRLQEEWRNTRESSYIGRIIITDVKMERILQLGSFAGASMPVSTYNVGRVEGIRKGISSEWEDIVPDLFYNAATPEIITFFCPVYSPEDHRRIGTVFMGVTTNIVTDKLKGYELPEGAELYLNLGGKRYLIQEGMFILLGEDEDWETISQDREAPASRNTFAGTVRARGGEIVSVVSYPVRRGISITQVLSGEQFIPKRSAWLWLLAGMALSIFVMAMFVIYSMDRHISKPVALLRSKISAIAGGDFSPMPELESDTELGQVGKGINKLAHDVFMLMNNRVADEKHRQELEYRMLQSQINPHFLYNTLGSIKWMATIQGADGIAEVTTALSRLLKTIAKDIRKLVPLRDELALLDNYLIIQKYRYGDSIALVHDIRDESLLDALIPRFSLQPLIENAIFHGLEPKGGGKIKLDISRGGGDTLISITDDGVGMSSEAIEAALNGRGETPAIFQKLGIKNVDERLRVTFGDGYGIHISSVEGQYTTMSIRLPNAPV
ncbi:MAG: sensor histidine kinase [Oscillospiraceae bacterium]|nr:sensor histidine kinase [Oscillospiraceae bacterium]